MNCPVCGEKTEVLDTVHLDQETYRRKRCKVCGEIFFTEETITHRPVGYYDAWAEKRHKLKKEKIKNEDC